MLYIDVLVAKVKMTVNRIIDFYLLKDGPWKCLSVKIWQCFHCFCSSCHFLYWHVCLTFINQGSSKYDCTLNVQNTRISLAAVALRTETLCSLFFQTVFRTSSDGSVKISHSLSEFLTHVSLVADAETRLSNPEKGGCEARSRIH